MRNIVRTTITLPSDLLQEAKIKAVMEKTSLSELIKQSLEEKIKTSSKPQGVRSLQGKYSLGITSTLSREEIYGDYLRKKVPH